MLRRARDRNILIQFKKPDGMPTNTCEANKFRTLRACPNQNELYKKIRNSNSTTVLCYFFKSSKIKMKPKLL